MLICLLAIILLYVVGNEIDKRRQHNIFVGGLLPFIGWRSSDYGPMKFTGFFTAWFWHGIMWRGVLRPKD